MTKKFNIGDQVEDTWWSNVCGTVVEVYKYAIHIRAEYPSLVPSSFNIKNGVVTYDYAHFKYLKITKKLSSTKAHNIPLHGGYPGVVIIKDCWCHHCLGTGYVEHGMRHAFGYASICMKCGGTGSLTQYDRRHKNNRALICK